MQRRSPRACEGCGRTYQPSSAEQRFCNFLCGHRHKQAPTRSSAFTEPRFLYGTDRPACVGVDPEIFHPHSLEVVPVEAATVCYRCPLLHGCLAWALEQPAHLLFGIWAATNQVQRRQLVRQAG